MTEPRTPDEGPETPQEPQGAPEAPQDQPEPVEAPDEPKTVDEAAAESLKAGQVAVMESPAGSLTLRPNQKALDAEQHAALKAIGIDTATDPGVIPHLRAFVHMCQIRGLDPWAREAYLVGRGSGNNRKYTMQTGIDGYRKMGAATGKFIRVKKRLWTGSHDDDRSFVQIEDEDGDIIRKRIWFDEWPAARGNPGAAKVVIEHYDDEGQVTTTAAVANWEMFAPYNDVYEGPSGSRRKKVGPDGKPVQELGAMWEKGGPHMLAKCAEALAYRMAFPARMSGIYITEEMHRADQAERNRRMEQGVSKRREAFEAAQREQRTASPTMPVDDVVEGEVVEEPTSVAETVTEVVEKAAEDTAEAQRLLLAELTWQAEVIGQKPEAIARRRIAALKKNLDQFTAADLFPVVNGMRPMAIEAATRQGLPEAQAYAALATDGAPPVDVENLSPEDEGEPVATTPADPHDAEEHGFVETADGTCWVCGLTEGEGNHPEAGEEE